MNAQQGPDVIFYGDSITETWRGTDMSKASARWDGVPGVFVKHFSQYRALALGQGGAHADEWRHILGCCSTVSRIWEKSLN